MVKGSNGKILRIDLTGGMIDVEAPPDLFYRKYLGGNGFAAYYLLKELPLGVDPLSPDNILIFSASIMTGAPIAGFGRHSVGAKSPLTGFYGQSEAGGSWGPELKFSGYDAIIIKGKSDKPVYISIRDGDVQIKDASDIWGMNVGGATDTIRSKEKDDKTRIVSIGPAGENMVKFAGISADVRHYHGRTGMGAVMGSKNLKAVAVRGANKPEYADHESVIGFNKYFNAKYKTNADNATLNDIGTTSYYFGANAAGGLPTENFRKGHIELEFDREAYKSNLQYKTDGCYGCPVRCKQSVKAETPYSIDPRYGGPEFETWGAFGSCCGNADMYSPAKAHELCNALGLDTISTGLTISFAMECYENGLLTKEQTDGLELNFGNAGAMLELINKIAHREKGIGAFLADGSWAAANKLGESAKKYSISAKGMELALCDPRVKNGVALIYAMSPLGGDHLQSEHDGAFDPALSGYSHAADNPEYFMDGARQLGILEPVPSLSLGPDKVRLISNIQHFWSAFDALDLCIFVFGPVRTFQPYMLPEMINAVTGWRTTLYEIMKAGERITNMMRIFNLVHSHLKREDDRIPERLYDGLENGPMKGNKINREDIDDALTTYYELMGWDRVNGVPYAGRLHDLELAEFIPMLEESGIGYYKKG